MDTQDLKSASILVADDHPVVREGLVAILNSIKDFHCVGQASCVEEAIDAWQSLKPDIGLFDLRMPDGDAVSAITRIKKSDAEARILVVSSFNGEEEIYRVMRAGARGYMLKDSEPNAIVDAVRAVLAGRRYLPTALSDKLADRVGASGLSPREIEMLTLAANGQSNSSMAKELGISGSTVKFHLNNAYSKLGVSSRTAAITHAVKRGIISID
ncbi:MAG: response regulator transcription factor [Pseudomonadota bacterium]